MREPLLEEVLIKGIKRGDIAAFSTIFATYYRDLVFYARRYTNSQDLSEEIVQEVFTKIWEDRHHITIQHSLKSYLISAVQNRCIDWFRHESVKKNHHPLIREKTLRYEYSTENDVLASELAGEIDKALLELPPGLLETFRLSRHEGLSYSQIAEKLNVSQRTVEERMGKALRMLRELLKDYFPLVLVLLAGFC